MLLVGSKQLNRNVLAIALYTKHIFINVNTPYLVLAKQNCDVSMFNFVVCPCSIEKWGPLMRYTKHSKAIFLFKWQSV